MKKMIALVLVAASLLITVSMILSVSAANKYYIRGDADGDGEVSILDATTIRRQLAGIDVAFIDERAADVDGNGVDITDATNIQRYLVEFENIYQIDRYVAVPVPTTPLATRDPYELPFIPNN